MVFQYFVVFFAFYGRGYILTGMKAFVVTRRHLSAAVVAVLGTIMLQAPVSAQPFGKGVYSADVPYGSATSLAISFSTSVGMTLMSNGSTLSGNGSHVITVTSTDVVGYDLYIKASTTTSMTSSSFSIAATSSSVPAALSVNTWGYNTTGSTTDFRGITLQDVAVKTATGPYKNGDSTTITYGALVDISKGSGAYTVDLTYTAVGKS